MTIGTSGPTGHRSLSTSVRAVQWTKLKRNASRSTVLHQTNSRRRRKRYRVHYAWTKSRGMISLSASGFHHAMMLARKFISVKEAEITHVETTGQSDRRFKLDQHRTRVKQSQ